MALTDFLISVGRHLAEILCIFVPQNLLSPMTEKHQRNAWLPRSCLLVLQRIAVSKSIADSISCVIPVLTGINLDFNHPRHRFCVSLLLRQLSLTLNYY